MMVAEPYVDELLSGHDLASLSEFARVLADLPVTGAPMTGR